MTRTLKSTLKSTFVSGLMALTLIGGMAAPAQAGGSIGVTIVPSTPEEAQAMRAGLAMFSLIQGIDANGGISQNGFNNAAGIIQGGADNNAVIYQDGNNHNGTIEQNGNGNTCGLFQFGEATEQHLVQNGGETCLAFQVGF